ncbi:NAD(P)-dependent alcohol dehydrogenase [Elongatibacter sediminis]|uniref:NAD(P)-dependent alcohol dehydrogenase n=1 Tax=Elongatibacter sediminis TaxID=3119006 RepID=A0AAW9RE91_9GAMM
MKLRYKLSLGFLGAIVIGIVILAAYISHDADCTNVAMAQNDSRTMRAVRYTCYGGPEVLQHAVIAKPEPADGEVLVRVRAAAVNPLDWHYLRGKPYIMRPLGAGIGAPADPKLGVDFAGVVEAVGAGVTRFKPGDSVFGGRSGAFGEYLVIPEDRAIAKMPTNVSFAEAAAAPIAAVTALQAVRDHGEVVPGDRVLINGASGGVGSFAVQIARAFGAEVTGVCSTRNVERVLGLGANHVIDYRHADYTRGDEPYDVIIDMVGNHSISANRGVLEDDGRLILVGSAGDGDWIGPLTQPVAALIQQPFVPQEVRSMLASLNAADLETLADLMRSGAVRPSIDRHYPLDRVAEAIAYSETGRAQGKIIIDID